MTRKTSRFFEKHERHLSSAALVGGFIFDTLTMRRIDFAFENLTILSYLVLSGGSIILINYYLEYPPRKKFFTRVRNLLPIFMQFAFGGLFSAFFIFYTRSATFSSSWPFMLILLSLLIGNEFFKNYYERLTFQVTIFFTAIFSFSIFFLPVLLKKMGDGIFVLSGIASLIIINFFSKALFRVVPKRYKDSKNNLLKSIASTFIFINMLYFLNLIPPIPLALKDAGVYHSVERAGGDYKVVGEEREWYRSLPLFPPEIVHLKEGAPIYVFSPVFAPTDLNTTVVHDWQYFNEQTQGWVSSTKTTFSITGGREKGYRVFSVKESLFAGKWRVDVTTQRGQIIGRVRFDVEITDIPRVLEEKIL
ncbi:MAG: DUF2914 domain-containing protein [Minisyncoccia bacterium]